MRVDIATVSEHPSDFSGWISEFTGNDAHIIVAVDAGDCGSGSIGTCARGHGRTWPHVSRSFESSAARI